MFAGGLEVVVLLVIVFVFFGAGKLPEVMRSIGESVRAFDEGAEEQARRDSGAAEASDERRDEDPREREA